MAKASDIQFSLENLYKAYRKAKIDVYFERTQPLSEAFADYESALHSNLTNLSKTLGQKTPTWPTNPGFIGNFGFIPKRLSIPLRTESVANKAHFGLSDPQDEWNHLLEQATGPRPIAEFRPVAHFTVDMYVVCALWVNLIGHKYDACLDQCARGSRLKRLRGGDSTLKRPTYHIDAPGSFQPYFQGYRQWRELGLKSIRRELVEGRRVVAITMDLTSFYHNVDASFLLNKEFLEAANFKTVNGSLPTKSENSFTTNLVTAFETWAKLLPHVDATKALGVPVGPSASRVIANVLLCEFDRQVQKKLAPVYYGHMLTTSSSLSAILGNSLPQNT